MVSRELFGNDSFNYLAIFLSDADFNTIIQVTMSMPPPLGENWKKTITPKKLRFIYEKI